MVIHSNFSLYTLCVIHSSNTLKDLMLRTIASEHCCVHYFVEDFRKHIASTHYSHYFVFREIFIMNFDRLLIYFTRLFAKCRNKNSNYPLVDSRTKTIGSFQDMKKFNYNFSFSSISP